MLRATIVGIVAMFVVMIPLLPLIGVVAVGVSWLAAGIGEAAVLIPCARKHASFKILPCLPPPAILAVIAASTGWFVSREAGNTPLAGLAGALTGLGLYLGLLWISHRKYLLDSIHLSARGFQGVLRRPAVR